MIYTMNDIAEIVKERTDGQGTLYPADAREMLLDMRDTYESELTAARTTIDVLRNEESALMTHKDAGIARLTDALNEAHAKYVEWSQTCDALDKRVDELETACADCTCNELNMISGFEKRNRHKS